MIRLVTIVCPECGHPHVATLEALLERPCCPFCGDRVRQAATPPGDALGMAA